MTDHKKNEEEQHHEEPEVISDTFYDDEEIKEDFGDSWEESDKKMVDRLADTLIEKVPFEVLEHLNNGRKEIVKAAISLAESRLKNADSFMERARRVHHKDKEEEPVIITDEKTENT